MITSENKPVDMSRLDWLWESYKSFNISNDVSAAPSDRIVLTEKAITDLIQNVSGGGITSLRFIKNPDDVTTMKLVGQSVNGTELTVVVIPKEEHITSFVNRKVTQDDVNQGCTYAVGTNALVITTNLNKTYITKLTSGNVSISTDADNIITTGTDGGFFATMAWTDVP